MGHADIWVDEEAHLLHISGHTFPCDREIVTALSWKNHALLLSADTDCLSQWDTEGLVRTVRVGVYPQDMTVQGDTAYVCGGADGMLHLLSLPDLHKAAEYPLPGMPERVCVKGNTAHLLTLLTDPHVATALLTLDLPSGKPTEVCRFPGLPGAITADASGLWIGISELVLHLPSGAADADVVIEGIGLPRRIDVLTDGVLVYDELEGNTIFVRT